MMGDLLENFPSSMWTRAKHARKACGDLWGQSTILETVPSNYLGLEGGQGITEWYQSSTFDLVATLGYYILKWSLKNL